MANAGTLINLFSAFGFCVSLVCTDNLWSPCGGDTLREQSRCDHTVKKGIVIEGMRDIILDIKRLYDEETERLNVVPFSNITMENIKRDRRCRKPELKRKVKIKKKIKFIHKTFADLVFVHHMMETVFENLTLGKKIMRKIKHTMCLLYQANMSLQCRKNGKPKKNVKTFDKTVKCRKKSIETCFPNSSKRTALLRMEKAMDILNKTTNIWTNFVNDKFILKLKSKRTKKGKRKRKSRQNTKKTYHLKEKKRNQ